MVSMAHAAPGDTLGTAQQTIKGSIVNSTCTVSFPADYTFAPISTVEWDRVTVGDSVVTQHTGDINLTQCPANSAFDYTITTASQLVGDRIAKAEKVDGSGVVDSIGMQLLSANDINFSLFIDGSKRGLATVNDQGNATIPVWANIVKLGELTQADGSKWSGEFQSVYTYTITYR